MNKKLLRLSMMILMVMSISTGAFAQFSGGGTGTAADPFKILTATDMNNVRNYIGSANANKHFRLMNDIDLTTFLNNYAEGWLPIGDDANRFTGYFHGAGHKISGLWINRPTVDYVGLFGANAGTIDSLGVAVSTTKNIAGRMYTAALAGRMYSGSKVNACNTTGGTITATNDNANAFCGGITASNEGGTVTNCYTTGNCTASAANNYNNSYSGGLIGYNTGTVTNCYVTGNSSSSSSNSYSGGLIGINNGTVTNCYATGNSSSSNSSNAYSGGLIGYNTGTVTNCYATGNSAATTYNIYPYSYLSYSGGFVGYNTLNNISNCYATGNSTSSGSSATSGGFAGYLYSGKISNCYCVGLVTGGIIGAFVGYCGNATYLSQCYYNSDITGSMSATGNSVGNNNALGKTTAGMKMQSTFVNWDFAAVWVIEENVTYPYLQNMPNYLEGFVSACQNSTQTYSTYTGKTGYIWTVTNGSITAGQSTARVTVKWANNTNAAKISVAYNGAVQASKDITLVPLPKPTIAGSKKPDKGATVTYSTEANMSNYLWTVTGGTVVSGLGTSQISVKWDCATTTGHVKVNYDNENGCTATAATDSTITYNATPPSITGTLQTLAGSTVTYTTEASMTNYNWTVTGGTITSGQGTRQVAVKWDCSAATTANIKVDYTNQGGCNLTMPAAIAVTLQANSAPNITGTLQTLAGSTVTYTTEASMTNYNWTVTGGTITSGQGTRQVAVKWDCSAATAANIKVDYTNQGGCNLTMPVASVVTLDPNTAPTITGDLQPNIGTATQYTTEASMSNYIWTATGGNITSGQGTKEVYVSWSATSGVLTVNYTNANGCTVSSTLNVNPVQLFGGGTGTVDNPFLIKTAAQLDNVRLIPDAAYSLANDIDLSSYLSTTTYGWIPINNFSGILDGRYYKIKNLWINMPPVDGLGLFSYNNGNISRLYVTIGTKGITGNNELAGLAALNYGTITQCSVTGGSITASGIDAGGLVGENVGNISQSYSANTVIFGNQKVGGLVGYNWAAWGSAILDAKINQCYAINTVVGSQYVGGLIGNMDSGSAIQSYSAGLVDGGTYTGGFIGYNDLGIISGCYYDNETSQQYDGLGNPDNSQYANIKSKFTSDMKKKATFLAWDFNNVWKIDELVSYPYFQWQDNAPISAVEENIYIENIKIYPNPVRDELRIESDVPFYNLPFTILDLTGRTVKTLHATSLQNGVSINVQNLPSGVYFVKIETEKGIITRKFVKE